MKLVTNDEIAADLKEDVIKPVIPREYLDEQDYLPPLNPSGCRFVHRWPTMESMAVLTGRKESSSGHLGWNGGITVELLSQDRDPTQSGQKSLMPFGVPEPLSVLCRHIWNRGEDPRQGILKIVKENFDFRPGMMNIQPGLEERRQWQILEDMPPYGPFWKG
ncbi:S-adenosylmethionine synthase, partial [Cucurbita argyrosperma subsp. sororia]